MKRQTENFRRLPGTSLLLLLALATTPALAETDRITVEDPATSVVNFKVTNLGNVTAVGYAGDGSALTNVAHWKGTWSAATAYLKDDCVYSGGSSYIALAASTNTSPASTPASWAVLAQQGPAGAAGTAGTTGPVGATGATGAVGPSGSPDTQAQIISKLATRADGAVLVVQQGPTEAGTVTKFRITDASGLERVSVTPSGVLNVASDGLSPTLYMTSSTSTLGQGPVFAGRKSRGTLTTPQAIQAGDTLFSLNGIGHNGTTWATASNAIAMVARDNFSPTAKGADTIFLTTYPGTVSRAERFRVTGEGNVGIGTNVPSQKLEVNGGIRLSTITTQPACVTASRGTFWVIQGGSDDTVQICVLKNGVLEWKTVQLQ